MDTISTLFWSGGKDSLLALRMLEKSTANISLLTACDEAENMAPVQAILLRLIREQSVYPANHCFVG